MNPHELSNVEAAALEDEVELLHARLQEISSGYPWGGLSDPRRIMYDSLLARIEAIDRKLELHNGDYEDEW